MTAPTTFDSIPLWKSWVLTNLQTGLLVLDADARIVFANSWLLRHAQMKSDDILNRPLMDVFPMLKGGYFQAMFEQVMRNGFPVLMSQTLHPSPFPLFLPNAQRSEDRLLRQSIRILPMSRSDAALAGQRYTMIQINDVTSTIVRERLLKAQADKLHRLANIDVLTGIGNRRFLDESLANELSISVRARTSVGLVIFDIDFFKQFNDHYGHLAGDVCLRKVAEALLKVCRRPSDKVARFGGEEMVAVLPSTDLAGCRQVAEDVLAAVRGMRIPHVSSQVASIVTVSAGVAMSEAGAQLSPAELLGNADRALYAAKAAGRNGVSCFSAQHGHVTLA
nr:diguanylate cyclase [uncultured Rhodoferax sp.]